ncbi:MAG: type II toxin-antitoxin system VapC family toxin [Saprospiraceae bacterium]|nr:type II toxin-antitoxin system VapC family toxin [Lewinellaceae bacterium]
MIILDTNVVSELMRENPDPAVTGWIRSAQPDQLTLSVIAIAEILRGISRLPEGRKKEGLWKNFNAFVAHAFKDRILPFDEIAARYYGEVAALREKVGLKADPVDMFIAAIARAHNAAVATRNIRDFEGCGIKLINPWQ